MDDMIDEIQVQFNRSLLLEQKKTNELLQQLVRIATEANKPVEEEKISIQIHDSEAVCPECDETTIQQGAIMPLPDEHEEDLGRLYKCKECEFVWLKPLKKAIKQDD